MLIEACCDSVASARAAVAAGATRVELCGPGEGGTTPSHGTILRCRDTILAPLAVMVRPRSGGFVYSDDEIAVMVADIRVARSLGVERIVVGALTPDDRIDRVRLAILADAAAGLPMTMHRAFDRTPDPEQALDTIMALGFDTVLTSGGARSAPQGAAGLARLQHRAGARLTVMAGGGVRGENVAALVRESGVRAVHARATDPAIIGGVVHALHAAQSAQPPDVPHSR